MRRPLALAAVLLAAGCSRQASLNYRHCLKLRVGMTQEQAFAVMGRPDETFPYVEGTSLPHLKGRTAYEWSTPASMSAPIRVSFDDASGKTESIRCGDSVVTSAVYVEPPESVAPAPMMPAVPAAAPLPGGPREHGSSNARSSGRPLTE